MTTGVHDQSLIHFSTAVLTLYVPWGGLPGCNVSCQPYSKRWRIWEVSEDYDRGTLPL